MHNGDLANTPRATKKMSAGRNRQAALTRFGCLLIFGETHMKHGVTRTVDRLHQEPDGFLGVLGVLARANVCSAPADAPLRLCQHYFCSSASSTNGGRQIGRASCRERVCRYG